MNWYNYIAESLDTPLNKNIMLDSESLVSRIGKINKTFYHCYYDFEQVNTMVNYSGLLRPAHNTIHFDFDSESDQGESAWVDVKKFCEMLSKSEVPFHVYFSGSKGFHVQVRAEAYNLLPGPKDLVEARVKSIVLHYKQDYPTLDTRIWNANRKFRAFNSKHEKTGLYKVCIDLPSGSLESWSLPGIRALAIYPQKRAYSVPAAPAKPIDLELEMPAPKTPGTVSIKELPQGQTIDDDSLKFQNFESKRCIKAMFEKALPQFNRHDIGLRLIYDLRAQGKSLVESVGIMSEWANKVFQGDTARIEDTGRMVRDAYSKPQDYRFGCYDEIKKAYCSAKCKIYPQLDKKKRAETLDCSKAQAQENEVRRNPMLELSEGEIADEILKGLPELCKSNGQFFEWKDTHWNRIDGEAFKDAVLKASIKAYGNSASIKQIENLAKHVITKIPIAPEANHFFSSCPNKFNFTDYTAIIEKDLNGSLKLVTKPHDKKDYLAYCAPFPLEANIDLPTSNKFKSFLDARTEDLGPDGIRVIKQMLGAALIPYAPRIFFIEGQSNAGKSTLALLIKKLLGEENVSEVQPVIQGNGGDRFNWEPSIGKLANIVLELDARKPLDTTVLKMVRDKTKISVDRKGQHHVKATLPFFHVYCCNEMPPSLEGNSGALNNRVSMLYFKPKYLNGLSGVSEIAETIWQYDSGSVLRAAREGLADLISSGFKYYEPDKSLEAVRNWQESTDAVSSYFAEIRSQDWAGPKDLEGKEFEKGSIYYSDFKDWCLAVGRKVTGRQHFYKKLTHSFKLPTQSRGFGGSRWNFASIVKIEAQNASNEKCEQNANNVSH